MTLSEYSHLKQQIIYGVVSSDRHASLLCTLKGLFKDDINSPRRLEQIDTVGELLKVLELRDLLSEVKLGPLKKIALLLPSSNANELMTRVNEYEAIPKQHQGNYYAVQSKQQTPYRESTLHPRNKNLYGQMSDEKIKRINNIIVNEIGSSWRDLARNLSIREKVINDIDSDAPKLVPKAILLLDIYLESRAEPGKWLHDLCDALEKTRRKDLSKEVKKIMLMNI